MNRSADPDRQLSQSWTANASAWTRVVREGRVESRRVATDAAILQAVLEQAPQRVLDLGCGEGWLCRALSAHGIDAVGVDSSAPLIESAHAAGGGQFHALSFEDVVARPEELGLGDFDAAVCNFSLLQEELAPLLGALRSLLNSRGMLLIQTVHPWSARGEGAYVDGWRTETFSSFGEEFPEPMPWYYRTLSSWVRELSGAEYQLREVREPSHPATGEPLSLLFLARRDE